MRKKIDLSFNFFFFPIQLCVFLTFNYQEKKLWTFLVSLSWFFLFFFLEEFFSKFHRIIPTVISSLNSIDKNYLLFFQESLAAKYQILIILCENGRRSFFCTNFRKWKSFLLNHHYCRWIVNRQRMKEWIRWKNDQLFHLIGYLSCSYHIMMMIKKIDVNVGKKYNEMHVCFLCRTQISPLDRIFKCNK